WLLAARNADRCLADPARNARDDEHFFFRFQRSQTFSRDPNVVANRGELARHRMDRRKAAHVVSVLFVVLVVRGCCAFSLGLWALARAPWRVSRAHGSQRRPRQPAILTIFPRRPRQPAILTIF